jgi:hypothetical protein
MIVDKPEYQAYRIINECRQVGICEKCNSSLIRKYFFQFWGKKKCINENCKTKNDKRNK